MSDNESIDDRESTREMRRGTKYESSDDEPASTSHGRPQQGVKRTLSQLNLPVVTEETEHKRLTQRERRKRRMEREYREMVFAKHYLAKLAQGESSSSDEEKKLMKALSSKHSNEKRKVRPDSPVSGKYLSPLFWETFFNEQENAKNRDDEAEDQNAAKTIYTQLGPDENQPSTSGTQPQVVGDFPMIKGLCSRPTARQICQLIMSRERGQYLDTVDEEDDLDLLELSFQQLNASTENEDANTTVTTKSNDDEPSADTNIPRPGESDDIRAQGDTCLKPKWENEDQTESDDSYVPDNRTYVIGRLDNIDDANTTDGETVTIPEGEIVDATDKKFTHYFLDDDLAELLAGEPDSSDEETLSDEEESDYVEELEEDKEDDADKDDEGAGGENNQGEMDVDDSNIDNAPDAMDHEEPEDEMMEDGETNGPDQVTDDVTSMIVDERLEDSSPLPDEPVPDIISKKKEFKFGQRPGLRRVRYTTDRNPILGDDNSGMMQRHILKKVPQRSAGNPITGEGYDDPTKLISRYTHTKRTVSRSEDKPTLDDDKPDTSEVVGHVKRYTVKSITEIGNGIEYNVFPPAYKMRITRRNTKPVSDGDNVTMPATPLTKFTPDTGYAAKNYEKDVKLFSPISRRGIRRKVPFPTFRPKVRMGFEQLLITSMVAKFAAEEEFERHLADLHFFDKCWDSLWTTKRDTSKEGQLVSELSNLSPSKTNVSITSNVCSEPASERFTRSEEDEGFSDTDHSEYGHTETERHPEAEEVRWPENCYSNDNGGSDSDTNSLEHHETRYSEEGQERERFTKTREWSEACESPKAQRGPQARERQVSEARRGRPVHKRGISSSKFEKRSKTGRKRTLSHIRKRCISKSSSRFGSKAPQKRGLKALKKTKSKAPKKVGSKAPEKEETKVPKKTGLKASKNVKSKAPKKTGLNAPEEIQSKPSKKAGLKSLKRVVPQSERVCSASDQESLKVYSEKDMQVCIYNGTNRQPASKPSFMSFGEHYNVPKTVEELAALHINDKISVTGESESVTSSKDYYHGYYTTSDDSMTVKSLLELEWPYEVNDPDVVASIEEEIIEEEIPKKKKISKGKISKAEVSTSDGEDGKYDTMGFGPLLNDIFSCLQETGKQMAREKNGQAKQQKSENMKKTTSKLKKKSTTKKQKEQISAKGVNQGPYGTEIYKSKKTCTQKKSKPKAQEKDVPSTSRRDHVKKSQDDSRQPKPAQTSKLSAQCGDNSAPSTSRRDDNRQPKPVQTSKLSAQCGDNSTPSASRRDDNRQPKPVQTSKLSAQCGDNSAPSASRRDDNRQPKPVQTSKLSAQCGDNSPPSASRRDDNRQPKPVQTSTLSAQCGDNSPPSASRRDDNRQPKPVQTSKLSAQCGDYSPPSASRRDDNRQPKPVQTSKLSAQCGDNSPPSASRRDDNRQPKPVKTSTLSAQCGDYSPPSASRRNDVQKKMRKVLPNTSARVMSPPTGHRNSNEEANEMSFSKWTKKSQEACSTRSKENLALPKKLPGRTGESGLKARIAAGAPNRNTVQQDSPSKMLAARDPRENILRPRLGPIAAKYVSPYSMPLDARGMPESLMRKQAPTVVKAARRVPKIDPYSAEAIARMRRKPDWQ